MKKILTISIFLILPITNVSCVYKCKENQVESYKPTRETNSVETLKDSLPVIDAIVDEHKMSKEDKKYFDDNFNI